MNEKKPRLDVLLVELGFADSRAKAEALIRTSMVLVDDSPIEKPGTRVSRDAEIRLRGVQSSFVGRGGEKLAGALDAFGLQVQDVVAIDIGSSTGGFTDCLLQRGAKFVYAIDVGTNQLAHRLRVDPRVDSREQTHAKDLRPSDFSPRPSFAVMDVSFISVRKVLESVIACLSASADLLILVKPQFELEPDLVSKGGVVLDPALQERAIDLVTAFISARGFQVHGAEASVLKGNKKGNQEYFIYASR